MILPYMRAQGAQTHITESYVSSPPALVIVDEQGAIWTLGVDLQPGPRGEFAFDVLRNGLPTGEFASRIERRNGRVRIFGVYGFKRWARNTFI